MKKMIGRIGLILIALIAIFVYYYVTLPAINIHSTGFWFFLILLVAILLVVYAFRLGITSEGVKTSKVIKVGIGLMGIIVIVFIIGSVLSSPIVNSKKYQQLLTIEEREFTEDIEEISFNKIPLLDRDSAILLGNRKMGSMIDMVSQFEVSDLYTQINYKSMPVRVTPLVYASTIKWLTNQKNGIPAYIQIDMTDQTTECVKLEKGKTIKYSPAEHFNRNLYRHLRFRYPTYIFDSIDFELDEEGTPYWTCSVKKFEIGLFGGQTVGRVVLCNALTGETIDYAVEDVPTWVDKVYSPELLIQLYDYYGTLKHGFLNSILGQRDCLKTTEGYNYIALEDDVWVYTGITSVSGDNSNVGFVLMNQRTKETRFYSIPGAEEFSAMSSAEGQVQNLRYNATFPLLLNIAEEPTYFIALKDGAGLVKKYAMVNIQKYQIVAIGDSVIECEKEYIRLLKENGISANTTIANTQKTTGIIEHITQAVVDGNSHFYLTLQGDSAIYDVAISDAITIVTYQEGDNITLSFEKEEELNRVISIE